MGRLLLNSALLLAAFIFYNTDNTGWAVVCAMALVYRVLQNRIVRVANVVARLDAVPSEHGCNTAMTCWSSLEDVLAHPSVVGIFDRLKAAGKAPTAQRDEWVRLLITNYQQTYKRDKPAVNVRFNIKNNLLFTDGEVDFRDSLYHELFIPYSLDEVENDRHDYLTPRIETGLSLRVFVVNGMLLVQVGDFDKQYTPKMLKDSFLPVYERWATITRFPLLYFADRHSLPVRYLNLSWYATESYKSVISDRGKKAVRRSWPWSNHRSSDDWAELNRDVALYRMLCDDGLNGYNWSSLRKIAQQFEAKRQAVLTAEGFKTSSVDRDDDWRFPDTGEAYWNDYLHVECQNFNLQREYAERRWLPDYYEEQP